MSGYSRWDQQPALGRRGMVVAFLVPVLIAAAAFGVVALVSRDSGATPTNLRVPQSSWKPGQDGGDALIRGILSVDQRTASTCSPTRAGCGRSGPRATAAGSTTPDTSLSTTVATTSSGVMARTSRPPAPSAIRP